MVRAAVSVSSSRTLMLSALQGGSGLQNFEVPMNDLPGLRSLIKDDVVKKERQA